jgi:hypothetical protein
MVSYTEDATQWVERTFAEARERGITTYNRNFVKDTLHPSEHLQQAFYLWSAH